MPSGFEHSEFPEIIQVREVLRLPLMPSGFEHLGHSATKVTERY